MGGTDYRGGWCSEVKASASNAGDAGSIPGSGRSPEKEMVIHSSILAWRIPRTEKPGRLQSTGCRVGHDWATSLSQITGGRGFRGGVSDKEQDYHQCRRYETWVQSLENPMDRGAWRATVHRVKKSLTQLKQLIISTNTCQSWDIVLSTPKFWTFPL